MWWRSLFCICALFATPAEAVLLQLEFRDVATGNPTACRLRLLNAPSPFDQLDPALLTHSSLRLGSYIHAPSSLTLDLAAGDWTLVAIRGMTGKPEILSVSLAADESHVMWLESWVDPSQGGWFGGDVHAHVNHGGGDYTPDPLQWAPIVAAAEGLDILFALENDALNPSGGVGFPSAAPRVQWGEEYRNSFWGHVVLLDLPTLITTPGTGGTGAGCCGVTLPAWPTLQSTLDASNVPLAILAHPYTTDDPFSTSFWPGSGFAREKFALTLGDHIDGLAVASGSNFPDAWARDEYLDSIRAGATWAAVGEGDRSLDRYDTAAPGTPRTYAQVAGLMPDDPGFIAAWLDAVRQGRTFATTGPILHEFDVNGSTVGSTVNAPGASSAQVHVRAQFEGALSSVALHGQDGVHLQLPWPAGQTDFEFTTSIPLAHDDFVVVELNSNGQVLPFRQIAPRAVSSPIWIDVGTPSSMSLGLARRAADDLAFYFDRALADRGFDSPADSSIAHGHILGAAQVFEDAFDDPPVPFELMLPDDGSEQVIEQVALRWYASVSHDAEPVSYQVEWGETVDFIGASSASTTSLSHTTPPLSPGQTYYWRVFASEPGEPPLLATDAPWSFQMSLNPVAVLDSRVVPLQLISMPFDGRVRIRMNLGVSGLTAWSVYDLRGRLVHRAPATVRQTGNYELHWDGRDSAGHRAAAGTYMVSVQVAAHTQAVRVTLPSR